MRLLLIVGSHQRHLWFAENLAERFNVVGLLAMPREDQIPETPDNTSTHDSKNFVKHFLRRREVEEHLFNTHPQLLAALPTLRIERNALNSFGVVNFVQSARPDACIVFGSDIIKEPLLSALPEFSVNIHLGLSPWYRGAATLFWPFYNLEPNWAGATLHYLVPQIDAGPIVMTVCPELVRGDGIHEVGARAVAAALGGAEQCLENIDSGHKLEGRRQSTTGRLYLARHFRAEHLRVNYDLFNDQMVDAFLNGEIAPHKRPDLIRPSSLGDQWT